MAPLSLMTATGAAAASPSFSAVGSAEQVYVTGLAPTASMSLLTSAGQTLSTQSADSLGGLLFRKVPPGKGYHVRLESDGEESSALTVHSDRAKPWDPGIYDQSIPDSGYGYLTTRDGTKLAIDVHPPTSPAGEPGLPVGTPVPNGPDYLPPYPTLIEYSGYGYADPAGPVNGIAVLANLMGFAVVDVKRAVACAIAMQQAIHVVNDINQARGLPAIEIGVGVASGEVVVGNIGSEKRSKHTAIGSAINLAARIESFTAGGEILISPATYDDLIDLVDVDVIREFRPKGFDGVVQARGVSGIRGTYAISLR